MGASQLTVSGLLAEILFKHMAGAKQRGQFPAVGPEYDFFTYALTHARASNAQLVQDLWVLYELGERRGGYFVEFGAGDGVVLSNSWLLEREYGWTGVLAEPSPAFHAALRRNRGCHISTKCVVGSNLSEVRFNQTADPHFSTIESYTGGDMHGERRASGERMDVPAQRLEDLLREAGAPRHIDYLSIDTEGSELEILQDFDFMSYDISLITVEHNYTPQRKKIHALLTAKGFTRRLAEFSQFDDWYMNNRCRPRGGG